MNVLPAKQQAEKKKKERQKNVTGYKVSQPKQRSIVSCVYTIFRGFFCWLHLLYFSYVRVFGRATAFPFMHSSFLSSLLRLRRAQVGACPCTPSKQCFVVFKCVCSLVECSERVRLHNECWIFEGIEFFSSWWTITATTRRNSRQPARTRQRKLLAAKRSRRVNSACTCRRANVCRCCLCKKFVRHSELFVRCAVE